MKDFFGEWLSLKWFGHELLRGFTWENEYFLYFIPAIPLVFIAKWLVQFFLRKKLLVSTTAHLGKNRLLYLFTLLPVILMMLSLVLFLISLARPQQSNETVEQWSEGIDIMLAIDISESMKIEDFKPNRLEAAKEVARKFVLGRIHDRIGLTIFSGDAYSLSPLTTDYQLLTNYINDIKFLMIEKSGTAIGSAIAVCTNRLRESETKSKVLVLLTDGDNNAGNIDPVTAAQLAYAYNIKIYTILVGKEGQVPYGKDFFGNTRYVENSVDEAALKNIANIGKGSFFRATNKKALEDIFERINQYEKAEIKESRYKDTQDFYDIYLKWGMLFFLSWLFIKNTFINNFIED